MTVTHDDIFSLKGNLEMEVMIRVYPLRRRGFEFGHIYVGVVGLTFSRALPKALSWSWRSLS